MTKQSGRRIVEVSEFCASAEEMVRFAESGGVVTLARDGRPVATLSAGWTTGADTAEESPAAYSVRPSTAGGARMPSTALVRLLGGRAVRSVLAVFLREAEREVHQREVARRAGLGLRSAQLALARLESLGLIESRRDGNRRYYRATRDPRFEELRRLLGRDIGIPEVLARHLAPLADRIRWAFAYGSVVTGTDRVGSDVDVLVVGDVREDELVEPVAAAQRELEREVDVLAYSPEEYRRRLESGNHFLSAILAGSRIDLIGGPDDVMG